MATKGAKSKRKNEDWIMSRNWFVHVMTKLEFSSVKTPSIKILNGEHELYQYLKVILFDKISSPNNQETYLIGWI